MMSCSGFKEHNNMHDCSLQADDHDQYLRSVHIPKPNSSSSTTAAFNDTKNPNITTWSSSSTTPLFTPLWPKHPPCTNMLPFNVKHHHHHNKVVRVTSATHEQGSSRTHNMDVKDHPQDQMLLPHHRSSRWNPTPEQLLALEELYLRGIKTPTAQQIRRVTEVLRQFGKIEGKNVFYWFQNHRARERQKRRRQEHMNSNMWSSSQSQSQSQSSHSKHKQALLSDQSSSLRNKGSAGSTRTSREVEQNKWTPLSNCVSLPQQESASILQRAAMAERRTPGWIRYAEREVQQRMINTLVILNSHFPPPTSHVNTLCPNASYVTYLDTKALLDYNHCTLNRGDLEVADDDQNRETSGHTLELFPLQSDNLKGVNI